MRSTSLLLLLLPTLALGAATISNENLALTVDDEGELSITVRASGRVWQTTDQARSEVWAAPEVQGQDRIRWGATLTGADNYTLPVEVEVRLEPWAVAMSWSADADRDMPDLFWPAPLSANLADGRVSFTPYMGGLLLPWTDPSAKWRWMGAAHDLPYVGLSEGAAGEGYALVLDTPHDAALRLLPHGDDEASAPQAAWLPQLGKVGQPRAWRYEFVPTGGYVALAKRYRAIAEAQGLLVTLAEKTRRLPTTARLAGAPDVWGGDLEWAQKAWAAGFETCLFNYTGPRESMQMLADRGWLTSKYDNYADMFIEENTAAWDNIRGPENEVLIGRDGEQAKAWLTFDGKTQYLKRSTRTMLEAAQRSIPRDLAAHPYVGRFIDVTTADPLLEDWRVGQTQTRVTDVERRREFFTYVNSLDLVTGGEHGRFWAVPYLAYNEGMMSGSHFSWPAGHLITPDDLAGISDEYRRLGLGGAGERVPLWDLVFHDCMVSYWYWGDSTDFLYQLDPTITDRKDALNVLYGTPPMYWASSNGFNPTDAALRQRMWQSHDRTTWWHAEIWDREMTDHAALSEDRLLQRSTFAGGYEAVINLAAEPRTVTVGQATVTLPTDGFIARGPATWVERSLNAVGQVQTRGNTPRARLTEGATVTGLRSEGRALVIVMSTERLDVAAEGAACEVRPADIVPGWNVGATRVLELGETGEPARALPIVARGGVFHLPASERRLALMTGSLVEVPDLAVRDLAVTPAGARSGQPVTVGARLANAGTRTARGVVVRLTVDGQELARHAVDVPGQGEVALNFPLTTAPYDGERRVEISAELPAGQVDPMLADNQDTMLLALPLVVGDRPSQVVAAGTVRNPASVASRPVVSVAWTPPAGVDGRTLRVAGAGGSALPTQLVDGQLLFELPAPLAPGATWAFEVRSFTGLTAGPAAPYSAAAGRRLVTPVYNADLAAGMVTNLALAGQLPLVMQVQYSSAQTGWTSELGEGEFELLYSGPVQAAWRVVKLLAGGVEVTRTVRAGRDVLEVQTTVANSVAGLHNRIYTARVEGQYLDSQGRRATVDGVGEMEIDSSAVDWLSYGNERGGLLMVPDRQLGLSYWDISGWWGGFGFHHHPAASRETWLFGPTPWTTAQADAAAAALATPLVVDWAE